MIGDKELLERAMRRFSPEPGVVERFMRRRDRRRRNRRIGSALLALIIAVAGLGGAFAAFRSGEPRFPAAPPITPANVSDLRLLGSVPLGGSFAVSDGLVYMSDVGNHELEAFPESCFAVKDPCEPTWVAHLGADPGIIGAAGGSVYVATDAIYAYSATCATGGAICQPTWVGAVPQGCAGCWGGITLGADSVYVVGPGRLYAYPLSCTDRCQPAWVAKLPGAGWTSVMASSDVVVVKSERGPFIAFRARCGTDGSVCPPTGIWRPPGGGSLAAIARGEIFISSGGQTWAYPTSCTLGGPCQPLWSVPADGQVVVAGNEVFVSTGDGMKAFPDQCGTPCQPLWWALTRGPIVAADGLLFSFQGMTCTRCLHTQGILAFPTACGNDDAECVPAWAWRITGGTYVDQLVVTDRRIYAATDPKARGWSNGSELSVFGIDPGS